MSGRRLHPRRVGLIGCGIVAACALLLAQAPPDDGSVRDRLDAVRQDLVNLEFEKALAALEALLGDAGMAEADRAEALVLRAQTHVAYGDLDGAERDYRQLLRLRPGYQPDPSLTPKKALERFTSVQRELVGRLRIEIDPADAALTIDGTSIEPGRDGTITLLAGAYVLTAQRSGYDPQDEHVVVKGGQETTAELRLMPNSRTVVLSTEPDGVEVFMGGKLVGRTERPDGDRFRAAELVLENLPLQEHVFELRKECYRTERVHDTLTVDLLDRSPKRYRPVVMVPARSRLVVHGPDGAEVRVDGASFGTLPVDRIEVCAGPRDVEVRCGGRAVWRLLMSLVAGREHELTADPRPSIALVGTDEWPTWMRTFASRFSTVAAVRLESNRDLADPAGWLGLDLPPDTDLAVALMPGAREGARDRWYLYSPILRSVHPLDILPADVDRPPWTVPFWGLTVVDTEVGGPGLVVEVAEGGPAGAAGLTVGDRIVTVGERPVAAAAEIRAELANVAAGESVKIGWRSDGGETKRASIRARPSPRLTVGSPSRDEAMIAAAWAVIDGTCKGEPAAMANLALLLSRFGQHDLAADTWRRVRWGQRQGIGEGTTQYYLGAELQRLGFEEQAIQAYRRAASSSSTAFDDHGPAVAQAAKDRLADLGVQR